VKAMANDIPPVTPPAKAKSSGWDSFEAKLSSVLEQLEDDQFLILAHKDNSRYVQFAAQGEFGIRMESISSEFIEEPDQIDDAQTEILRILGWQIPTGSGEASTPELAPEGSPNFYIDFPAKSSLPEIAKIAVNTLKMVHKVAHPQRLVYDSFNHRGEWLPQPILGLIHSKKYATPLNHDELMLRLVSVLKGATGLVDLVANDLDEITIRFEEIIVGVRLAGEDSFVQFVTPLLHDVEVSPELLTRMNEINNRQFVSRYFIDEGTICCVAELPINPFICELVGSFLAGFCRTTNETASDLRSEFGVDREMKSYSQSHLTH